MSKAVWKDVARQVANVVGAIFQVAAPTLSGAAIGRVSAENPTLVVPADYAFVIWSPIFLLALIYAVYQALPANRENPLLRRIGWFSALAYFSNGIWELLFPARQFVLSQVVFVGIFGASVAAFVLVQRGAGPDSRVERWLLAPAFGLLAGWVTAAIFVGFATVLVAIGVLNGSIGEAILETFLLIVVGVIAAAVILASGRGPAQGYVAYAGAVLWAFAGVVANQYQDSALTSLAAVLSALLVVTVLFATLRRLGASRATGRHARRVRRA